jgi:hypothetical protein
VVYSPLPAMGMRSRAASVLIWVVLGASAIAGAVAFLIGCELLWPVSSYDEAPDACSNGIQDGAETDVDCGGNMCLPCGPDSPCLNNGDCRGGLCVNSRCAATCSDQVKNAAETDMDCGGGICSPCRRGMGCNLPSDCQSNSCQMNRCVQCGRTTQWKTASVVMTGGSADALRPCTRGCWVGYRPALSDGGVDELSPDAMSAEGDKWFALCDVPAAADSRLLNATGFVLDEVPQLAVIRGIQVRIARSTPEGGGESRDRIVRLLRGGTAAGLDRADAAAAWPQLQDGAVAPQDYGGDLWGTQWSATDIRSDSFGVQLGAHNPLADGGGCSSALVDRIAVQITYCD